MNLINELGRYWSIEKGIEKRQRQAQEQERRISALPGDWYYEFIRGRFEASQDRVNNQIRYGLTNERAEVERLRDSISAPLDPKERIIWQHAQEERTTWQQVVRNSAREYLTGEVKIQEEKIEFPELGQGQDPWSEQSGATRRSVIHVPVRVPDEKGEVVEGEVVIAYLLNPPIIKKTLKRRRGIPYSFNTLNLTESSRVIFDCEPSQIAHTLSEIIPDTKVYVGSLNEPGVFNVLQEYNVEHVYTSFPGTEVVFRSVHETGLKTKEQIRQELTQAGINIQSSAQEMIESVEFPEKIDVAEEVTRIVELTAGDLGFYRHDNGNGLDLILRKAQESGLELCSWELGLAYMLQHKDQFKAGERCFIGMKPIADSSPYPSVFSLYNYDNELRLIGTPVIVLASSPDKFVFSLPK